MKTRYCCCWYDCQSSSLSFALGGFVAAVDWSVVHSLEGSNKTNRWRMMTHLYFLAVDLHHPHPELLMKITTNRCCCCYFLQLLLDLWPRPPLKKTFFPRNNIYIYSRTEFNTGIFSVSDYSLQTPVGLLFKIWSSNSVNPENTRLVFKSK